MITDKMSGELDEIHVIRGNVNSVEVNINKARLIYECCDRRGSPNV